MLERQSPVGVIQICAIAPEPAMSASTFTSPGSITMYGETFHPRPSLRAGLLAGSGIAIAPLPFSPVGFSGLIERLSAFDKIGRLPRCMPRPLNDAIACDSSPGQAFEWLQFEIDGHEIMVRRAARKYRLLGRDNGGGSRNRMHAADREPVELRPHQARDQSREGKGRAVFYVDAIDFESAFFYSFEQWLVTLGRAEAARTCEHSRCNSDEAGRSCELNRCGVQIATENRAASRWKRLHVRRHLEFTLRRSASAVQMRHAERDRFAAEARRCIEPSRRAN